MSRVVEAEDFAAEFGAIAPVLPVPFDRPWQEISELIARGVGRMDQHGALLARYAATLERIRTDRADVLDARVVCFQVDLDGVYVDGAAGEFKSDIIADLGAAFAPIVDEVDPDDGLTLSAEQLDRVFAGADGFILVINTPEEIAALEANPLWSNQALVKAGRYVTADFYTNGGGPLTAVGVAQVIDDLYAALQS